VLIFLFTWNITASAPLPAPHEENSGFTSEEGGDRERESCAGPVWLGLKEDFSF
jgi:hypothetical protein